MLDFIKRRLKSDRGAMDKILVTLLFVVIGVAAVVGLKGWIDGQAGAIQASATTYISQAQN